MAITIHGSKKRLDAVWWLSFSSSIGLFLVNVSGFVDTETGSALGCGHQWPLCNDEFIPTLWNEHTLFEFAHRVLVLLIAVFLISTVIAVWHRYGSWLEVRVLAWISMGFVILESVIGAIAVLLPTVSPAILAITLGVSLLSFVGNVLLTVVLSQIQRRPSFGSEVSLHLRACEIPPHFMGWSFFTLGYTFLAMYVGAYLAKSNISDSFRGYPLPSETYHQVGFNLYFDFLHRGIAIGLFLLIIRLFVPAYRWRSKRPDLYKGALLAMLLVVGQILSGGFLILSHLSLLGFLIHVSVVSCLFATVAYLLLQSLPEPLRPSPSSTSQTPLKTPSQI